MLERCSTDHAPWYVIPSNHKWFRNLAVSRILADTLDDLRMKLPKPTVDLDAIRKEYHAADGRASPKRHGVSRARTASDMRRGAARSEASAPRRNGARTPALRRPTPA